MFRIPHSPRLWGDFTMDLYQNGYPGPSFFIPLFYVRFTQRYNLVLLLFTLCSFSPEAVSRNPSRLPLGLFRRVPVAHRDFIFWDNAMLEAELSNPLFQLWSQLLLQGAPTPRRGKAICLPRPWGQVACGR